VTEHQASEDRTASFRANNQRAIATARAAARDFPPLHGLSPEAGASASPDAAGPARAQPSIAPGGAPDDHNQRSSTTPQQGGSPMTSQWTPEAIRDLGATTDLPTLGSIFGLSTWRSRQMAHTGEWEQAGIRILKIGNRYRVAVPSIVDVLSNGGTPGIDPDQEHGAALREQPPGTEADGTVIEPSGQAAIRSRS
jgi:hypothetical protein